MKYLCLIILVLGLFTGCSDDPTNPDTTCPYVTIVYPNDGDAFFEGSFISVTAEATDNAAIDSVQFYLIQNCCVQLVIQTINITGTLLIISELIL